MAEKTIGFVDDYIYELPLDDDFNFDIDNPIFYEYDSTLTKLENIKRKMLLKEYGRELTRLKEYNLSIEFHNALKKNTYFKHDWYPYRQLTIIYDKTKDYQANFVNIKQLFLSGIYLNKYQYVWFTNKIRHIMENIYVNEDEVKDCLKYYDSHGSKNKSLMNKFPADQFTKRDNMMKVYSESDFTSRQEIYAYEEIGRVHEQVGNYELAIAHYKDVISKDGFRIFKFYQRICRCFEKLNDYKGELKAIQYYYTNPPETVTEYSDEWFEKRLNKVNKKLGTTYTVKNLQEKK